MSSRSCLGRFSQVAIPTLVYISRNVFSVTCLCPFLWAADGVVEGVEWVLIGVRGCVSGCVLRVSPITGTRGCPLLLRVSPITGTGGYPGSCPLVLRVSPITGTRGCPLLLRVSPITGTRGCPLLLRVSPITGTGGYPGSCPLVLRTSIITSTGSCLFTFQVFNVIAPILLPFLAQIRHTVGYLVIPTRTGTGYLVIPTRTGTSAKVSNKLLLKVHLTVPFRKAKAYVKYNEISRPRGCSSVYVIIVKWRATASIRSRVLVDHCWKTLSSLRTLVYECNTP